jgi:hypothetical protein
LDGFSAEIVARAASPIRCDREIGEGPDRADQEDECAGSEYACGQKGNARKVLLFRRERTSA